MRSRGYYEGAIRAVERILELAESEQRAAIDEARNRAHEGVARRQKAKSDPEKLVRAVHKALDSSRKT